MVLLRVFLSLIYCLSSLHSGIVVHSDNDDSFALGKAGLICARNLKPIIVSFDNEEGFATYRESQKIAVSSVRGLAKDFNEQRFEQFLNAGGYLLVRGTSDGTLSLDTQMRIRGGGFRKKFKKTIKKVTRPVYRPLEKAVQHTRLGGQSTHYGSQAKNTLHSAESEIKRSTKKVGKQCGRSLKTLEQDGLPLAAGLAAGFFTGGLGFGAMLTTGMAEGVATTAVCSSANAGLASVSANLSSLIVSNRGNLRRAISDTFSDEGIRSFLIDTATAGIASGVSSSFVSASSLQQRAMAGTASGTVRTISGENPKKAFRQSYTSSIVGLVGEASANNIKAARLLEQIGTTEQYALHAGLGAAIGTALGKDPLSGAFGAVVGEYTANNLTDLQLIDFENPESVDKGVVTSQVSSVLSSSIFSLNTSIASTTSENAARNNAFFVPIIWGLSALAAYDTIDSVYTGYEEGGLEGASKVAGKELLVYGAGFGAFKGVRVLCGKLYAQYGSNLLAVNRSTFNRIIQQPNIQRVLGKFTRVPRSMRRSSYGRHDVFYNRALFEQQKRYWASSEQMRERGVVIAGQGHSRVIDDVRRLVANHGGKRSDWVKKSSTSSATIDGTKIETHWYEDLSSGRRYEFKIKE